MKHSIDLIDEIVADNEISNTHLRMLVNKIKISESEKGLDIKILLNGAFLWHQDIYDANGKISESFIEIHEEEYEFKEDEDISWMYLSQGIST